MPASTPIQPNSDNELRTLVKTLIAKNDELVAKNDELVAKVEEYAGMILALREQVQILKDEIAVLKGQKPRPEIPPNVVLPESYRCRSVTAV